MWTYEVLPLSIDILNYLVSMCHVAQTSSIILKNTFICSSFGSCLWWTFLVLFSPNMFAYIFLGNRLLQATFYSCFAWSRQYLKLSIISIYLSIVFKSYPCHMLICCEVGLEYHSYIPPRNISIYSLSMTSDTHNCGGFCRPSSQWLLHWIALFIAKCLFWLPLSSLPLAWILSFNWYCLVL